MLKNRLGKGLGALLPDNAFPESSGQDASGENRDEAAQPEELFVPVDAIFVNPDQPRKHFDEDALAELSDSIKEHGIIQPLIVEEADGGFRIIAGERRCRAAKLAGLEKIPVIVRNYAAKQRLEVALIENIHREDLNPVEEAEAYKKIMENSGLSQDEAAARVGKNRSTVANALRLLKLPPHMQESLANGRLSAGHARAVLSLPMQSDQEKLYKEITGQNLSVRASESRASEIGKGTVKPESGKNKAGGMRDPQLKAIEEKFIERLGTKVRINGDLQKGRIEIEYYSMADLDRIFELLGKQTADF